MSRRTWALIIACTSLLVLPAVAPAVVKNLIPLRTVLNGEQLIFEAKVEKLDPDKPFILLKPGEVWKGKLPFTTMPIDMTGDPVAKRENETPKIFKRLAAGLNIVMFVSKRGSRYTAFAYSNGTWFQVEGRGESDDQLTWAFLHGEPYLRRTFKGTTAELKQAVKDGLAGKDVPKPDEKAEPGFGPEIEAKEKPADAAKPLAVSPAPSTIGLPLGVAPTFFLVGPLALLATLFPTVFGGLALLMRRWMAAMSVCCAVSTVYFLHGWFYRRLIGTWFESRASLWCVIGAISAAGVVWAARRYRTATQSGDLETFQIRTWDRRVLDLLSLVGLGLVGVAIARNELLRWPWLELAAFSVPAWFGAIAAYFNCSLRLERRRSVEVAFLLGLVVASGAVIAVQVGRAGANPAIQTVISRNARAPRPLGLKWERGLDSDGAVFSTPLVFGDRVYVAAARSVGLGGQTGVVLCLNSDSGAVIWTFDSDQAMKPVFSSPVLAEGRLYIGEGFHENKDCRLFCLNATNGKKLWQFQTESHVESTPLVANGKVYVGTGDDGIYCLDAVSGLKIWNYSGVHIDSTPVVADGRLYIGSGVGDLHKSTLLLCLDAMTGHEIWRLPIDLPAFASPTLAGNQVFFGTGNGDFDRSADEPRGGIVCVEAATGKRIWQFDAGDAVLSESVVDAECVYFTSRERNTQLYCVDRASGQARWKKSLGAPVVAASTLVGTDGHSVPSLYVASTSGLVECLNPADGQSFWTLDLKKLASFDSACVNAAPIVVVSREGEVERRRIFLAAQLSRGQTTVPRWYCFEDEVR
jgi:outer membrane protein assembly factor BamB